MQLYKIPRLRVVTIVSLSSITIVLLGNIAFEFFYALDIDSEKPDKTTNQDSTIRIDRLYHGLWLSETTYTKYLNKKYAKAQNNNLNKFPHSRELITAIVATETQFKEAKKISTFLPLPDTIGTSRGPMQVSLSNCGSVDDYFVGGISHLNALMGIYIELPINDHEKAKSIFGDWTAGAYASRVAGLQKALNEISPSCKQIKRDGDLGHQTRNLYIEYFGNHDQSKLDNCVSQLASGSPKNLSTAYNSFFLSESFLQAQQKLPIITEPAIPKAPVGTKTKQVIATLQPRTYWKSSYEFTLRCYANYQKLIK